MSCVRSRFERFFMGISSPTSAKLVDAVGTGAGAAEDAAALSFSCRKIALSN